MLFPFFFLPECPELSVTDKISPIFLLTRRRRAPVELGLERLR